MGDINCKEVYWVLVIHILGAWSPCACVRGGPMVTLCKGARSGGGRVTRLAKPSWAGDRHAIAVKPLLADNVCFGDSFIRGAGHGTGSTRPRLGNPP